MKTIHKVDKLFQLISLLNKGKIFDEKNKFKNEVIFGMNHGLHLYLETCAAHKTFSTDFALKKVFK